jgi:hypothetical protein
MVFCGTTKACKVHLLSRTTSFRHAFHSAQIAKGGAGRPPPGPAFRSAGVISFASARPARQRFRKLSLDLVVLA